MDLFAAVDVMGGSAVRLVRGEFSRATDHGDPVTLAQAYLAAGARWLHVVDLDAARQGAAANRPVVLAIAAAAHDAGAAVEVGGGVRSEGDVASLLGGGVDRVVLGTAAVEDPGLAVRCARRHPGRVAVGVDYRRTADGTLEAAVRGWVDGAGRSVADVLDALADAPLAAVVLTAIDRDGTLEGPDTAGLAVVLDATVVPVVASGGVGRVEDLRRLGTVRGTVRGRGPAGVVVGKALAEGRLSVKEAIAACEPCG